MTFQDLLMCVFQDFPGPFMSIFHVFPGLFNRMHIKQVRLTYTCTKSITLCKANTFQLTIHRSEMQQPFGLFSMTFQDLGLIPCFQALKI